MQPETEKREREVERVAGQLIVAFKDLDHVEPMKSVELKITCLDGSRFIVSVSVDPNPYV